MTQIYSYRDRILKSAYLYLGSIDDAEDICQDVFMSAINSIKNFRGDADIFTWLYRILINKLSKFIKRRSIEARYKDSLERAHFHEYDNPLHNIETQELKEMVVKAIRSLPEDMQKLIIMRYYEDFSGKQMAEIMNMSHARVRSRLSEAREYLRNLLKDHI